MVFVCSRHNDLYLALKHSGYSYSRFDTLPEAVSEARINSSMLVLADEYPKPGHIIEKEFLKEAESKSLRLYLEYPEQLPGMKIGHPQPTDCERVVVSSDFFGPSLPEGEILGLQGCWFLPMESPAGAHLKLGRIAGYRQAVYGIPKDSSPLLFNLNSNANVLVAASKLSNFITGRYGPKITWKTLWEQLLLWLLESSAPPRIDWNPLVTPAFTQTAKLPGRAEEKAYTRLIDWFRNYGVYSIGNKKGAVEGYESGIDYMGRQMIRTWPRGDCISETGMLFACDWEARKNPDSRKLAGETLDYVWSSPDFFQNDPDTPVYGLSNWYEFGTVFYGDDNARVILATLAASSLMKENRWAENVLKCLLANLRTTGPQGFRMNRFDYPESFKDGKGWQYYRDNPITIFQPHHQAYLWAAYLWGYALTGHSDFLDKTVNAVRMTMDAYPEGWEWTNGISQEMARMLLPLAWLTRIDDRAEYRDWLKIIFSGIYADMQPCGAIRERLGRSGTGNYPPPASNEAYGTSETPLIQQNGDTACDMLYTMGYAFIGLHEAFMSTGDEDIKKASDKLADFLCRVQIRSRAHPYLDGAWMRGFDYSLWDYWGSSADIGWGAWSVETGWTNTWIGTTFALRKCNKSLFDTGLKDVCEKSFPRILKEMTVENKNRNTKTKHTITKTRGGAPGAE